MSTSEFALPKRKYASRRCKGRHWWGKECVQHLSSEETPASIAEFPAPETTFLTKMSTASGKKLAGTLAAINFRDF